MGTLVTGSTHSEYTAAPVRCFVTDPVRIPPPSVLRDPRHRSSPYRRPFGAPRPSSPIHIQSVPPSLIGARRPLSPIQSLSAPVFGARDRAVKIQSVYRRPLSRCCLGAALRDSDRVAALVHASRSHMCLLEINENPTTLVRLQDGTAFIGRVHLSAAKIPRLPQDLESCTSHRLPTAHPAGSPVRLTAPKALHE